jgi:hypothetical protein
MRNPGWDMQLIEYDRHEAGYRLELQRPSRNLDCRPAPSGLQKCEDASLAAGPVGRHASAATDLKINAEILSYSRAKGVFAGVSLDGAVVQADKSGDQAMYGEHVTQRQDSDP